FGSARVYSTRKMSAKRQASRIRQHGIEGAVIAQASDEAFGALPIAAEFLAPLWGSSAKRSRLGSLEHVHDAGVASFIRQAPRFAYAAPSKRQDACGSGEVTCRV